MSQFEVATEIQGNVLKDIAEYYLAHRIPPTHQDLADQRKCRPNNIVIHYKALQKKGYITSRPGASRSVLLTSKGWEYLESEYGITNNLHDPGQPLLTVDFDISDEEKALLLSFRKLEEHQQREVTGLMSVLIQDGVGRNAA